MLTYILSHRWHCLAVSDVRAVWVCLCRDRLELVANIFPQSGHCLSPFRLVVADKSDWDEEYSDEEDPNELSDIAGEDDLDEALKSSGSCIG